MTTRMTVVSMMTTRTMMTIAILTTATMMTTPMTRAAMTPTTTAHFHVFLYGARFIVITYHAALQYPKTQRDNPSR